ncbi:hypothetical protein VB264_09520 [Arcicella aquatica]|uniref:Nucleotidyltransferase n=1 Tax=Arcicella aquatica TaxID=217141 RepID=A0ABU5QLT1_9BACT|nr:hypothetical protein [Arcicella aquatica]MEA5258022.1 hypothetical protein [Arcicella aquatica]
MSKSSKKISQYKDFQITEMDEILSPFSEFSSYSLTKRDNLQQIETLYRLLPEGYVSKRRNEIESIDFIYSGSSSHKLLLTLMVGRNDAFKSKECFDIDVFNIAPYSSLQDIELYFGKQWHHFKDIHQMRVSFDVYPTIIGNEIERKNMTYRNVLSGSTGSYNMEEYRTVKKDFFDIHRNCIESILRKSQNSVNEQTKWILKNDNL